MIVLYMIISIAVLVTVAIIVNKLTIAEGFEENLSQQLTHVFNPLATTIVSASDANAVNAALRAATDSVRVESRSSTTTMLTTPDPSFLSFPIEPADVAAAKVCETIRQTDIDSCGLLTNASQQQCGFCLKDGTTHDGQPIRGGLYISNADRQSIEALATARGEKPVYKPTAIGSATCAPGYFFVGVDACKDGARQLSCAVGGSVKEGGTCGQCVDYPDNFVYVGPQPMQFDAVLRIIGDGLLRVSIGGKTMVEGQRLVWGQEITVALPQLVEGSVLTVSIAESTRKALVGQLEAGSSRVVPLDVIIGRNVRRLGTIATAQLPGVSPTRIAQTAFWMWIGDSNTFSASGPIPATVKEPIYPVDSSRCPTGALIMTPAGQKVYDLDPCRGTTPTTTCARFLWTSGGCTPDGTGYARAETLGSDKGTIATAVADLVSVQQSGKHLDGRIATRRDIVIATKQCSGQTLSACDGPFKNTGPQDPECLKEIYENPATYSADYPSCSAAGTMNPATNPQAYASLGGVNNIRSVLRGIQQNAVTGTTPVIQSEAMQQCYGLNIRGNDPRTCPAITAIIKSGRRLSIAFGTRYLRHAGYRFWIDPDDNSELMHNDSTFIVRPALLTNASPGSVSFESVNFPGFFIVSPGGQSTLSQARPGTDAASATYTIQIGIGGTFTLSTGGKFLALLQDGRSVGLATVPTQWTVKTALV